MSVVRTNAAAAMLGVSPNTLRSWERRFGYPDAAAHAGRPSPVRPRGDRGAAPGVRRDAQHLVRDLGRPPARRGAGVAGPSARRVHALRRGQGRPPARGEPRRPLGRAHGARRCSSPPSRRSPTRASRGARPSSVSPGATRPAGWPPPCASRRPPHRTEGVLIFDASRPARRRRAARPGARARACAAPGCARSRSASTSTPTRVSRACARSHPAALVLSGRRARRSTRSGGSSSRPAATRPACGPRLPRRAAGHRRVHRDAPGRRPLAARDALLDRLTGRSEPGADHELGVLLQSAR